MARSINLRIFQEFFADLIPVGTVEFSENSWTSWIEFDLTIFSSKRKR